MLSQFFAILEFLDHYPNAYQFRDSAHYQLANQLHNGGWITAILPKSAAIAT